MKSDDVKALAENHAARARELIGSDPEEAPARFKPSSMPVAVCEYIKDSHKSGYALENELGYSRQSIIYHREDRCVHDFQQIGERRCAVMREMARDDIDLTDISDFFGCTGYDAVSYHVRGNCSCGHSTPIVEQKRVDSTTCKQIHAYRDQGLSLRDVAERVGFSKPTVGRHAAGRCRHDHS